MFSSLRFRLWLTYVLVVGVVLCIAGTAVLVYLLRNPAEDRREIQRLRLISAIVQQRSQVFNILPENYPQARLQEAVTRADSATGVRLAIYSASGELLADSRSGSAPALPGWAYFANRRPGLAPIFRDEKGRLWLYTVSPLQGGDYLLLSVQRPRIVVLSILRDEFLTPFVRGGLLALVLSLFLAIWIARWIAQPLQQMADAARSVSSGEFRKIPLKGPSEVQTLARSFNEMGERVQASQRSQRDFIANVSHDLKTPLTSIQGFAQAILDGTADTPEALRQAASVIYSEAERMVRMVMDLLELARIDSGMASFERAPLELDELLKEVVEKFSPQARQAQVELQLTSSAIPTIIGDADRLAQVFTNLVDNALKYSPQGGQVRLTARATEGWVEVQIVDSGPGIPPDELERIFERFYQTDKSRRGGNRRGVGLGLAIAREIVQAHGGSVSAFNCQQIGAGQMNAAPTDTPGQGSAFLVRLPFALPDDTTLARRRAEKPIAISRKD